MKKYRFTLIRIIVAAVIFAVSMILFRFTPLRVCAEVAEGYAFTDPRFYAYLIPYLVAFGIVGYDVILRAGRNLLSGRLLDENFLMVVATFGAIALLDLAEACGVMLFYQVGELFQKYAVGKSRRSIASLMDLRPDKARVLRGEEEIILSPEEIEVGDLVVIYAGERVPVDGIVAEGRGEWDLSSLTGESMPRAFSEGEEVLGGAINLSGVVKIRAEKRYAESTVAKILEMVENASSRKAKTENFITKFARYYTPAVVIAAILIGVVPPLFMGGWSDWIKRALTFLVVSCPCALVISVPLSFFGGIGGASKEGVLIKGGNYLELLAKADVFLFDKTGTLTQGKFEVSEVYPESNRDEILRCAAIAEGGSNHPIAQSVLKYAGARDVSGYRIEEIPGRGMRAMGQGEVILAGNAALLREEGVLLGDEPPVGTTVYVARDGGYLGRIGISDLPKENAAEVIGNLRESGCRTVMLTGDGEFAARKVASDIGVTEYAAELLPQDKVERVAAIIEERKGSGAVCFVGDGINDAPVLGVADLGISMGGVGSDAAIEASDVVLMKDDLSAIPVAKGIAKRTMRIVWQNIIFALGVKFVVLLLAALGLMGAYAMWVAVFADVGVAMLAILNAMRTLRVKHAIKSDFSHSPT